MACRDLSQVGQKPSKAHVAGPGLEREIDAAAGMGEGCVQAVVGGDLGAEAAAGGVGLEASAPKGRIGVFAQEQAFLAFLQQGQVLACPILARIAGAGVQAKE